MISRKKLLNATKWSALTEILAKLVTPISSMILARILVPEVFGIVASVNMVISFCDVFIDGGFQKYVIQREYVDQEQLDKISTVAFWTNLFFSIVIWLIVTVFSESIAKLVGCEGNELAVSVACALLPLHALSSIPNARLKREMNFQTIFAIRVLAMITPFVVTLPIALVSRSYWSLICGSLANAFVSAVITFIKVSWKPSLFYDFNMLKDMLSFSMWSVVESILVWLINWGDMFIVGMYLSTHYLGVYKTSINMVNSIIAVISATVSPVMLSALSRLQNDKNSYKSTFYNISFYSGVLLIPMGVGMFVFKQTMCDIALGSAWSEGAPLMGIWGLVSATAILFNTYNGCVFISNGKPKISAIVQLLQILCIIPAVYISVQVNFICLSYTRALVRVVGMIINCIIAYQFFSISAFSTIRMLLPCIFSSLVMAVCGLTLLSIWDGIIMNIISIAICAVVYFSVLFLFPSTRSRIINKFRGKLKK